MQAGRTPGRKRARPQKDSARDKLLTNKQVLISYIVHPVIRDMQAMQINHMLKDIGYSCNRVTVRPSLCLRLTLLACFSFDHDVYFLLGASHNKYVPGSGCCCWWCLLWLHVACGMCCITRRLVLKKVERQSKRTAARQEFKRICSLKYVCAAHCPTYLHAHNTQTQMQLQQMHLQIQESLTTEIMQIERRRGGRDRGDSEKNNLRTKGTR